MEPLNDMHSDPSQHGDEVMFDEEDPRFEASPYAGPYVELFFRSRSGPLLLPRRMLQQSQILSSHIGDRGSCHLEYSMEVGHVVVHFLHAGTYQSLKPAGSCPETRHATDFATALQVFHAGGTFGLPKLRVLAANEIRRLGNDLSLPLLIDTAQIVHHDIGPDDRWLDDYLGDRIRMELHRLDKNQINKLLEKIGDTHTVTMVLLRVLMERELERGLEAENSIVTVRSRLEQSRRGKEEIDTRNSCNGSESPEV